MQTLEEEDEDWDEDQRSETSNSGGMILDSVLENRSILPGKGYKLYNIKLKRM